MRLRAQMPQALRSVDPAKELLAARRDDGVDVEVILVDLPCFDRRRRDGRPAPHQDVSTRLPFEIGDAVYPAG